MGEVVPTDDVHRDNRLTVILRHQKEQGVHGSARRVRFIGLEAYVEAGGPVMRDLFQDDDGGWIEDVPLLERLVAQKLQAEAETIAAEGWKWVEVAAEFPYGHSFGLHRLSGTSIDLSDEERAAREKLRDEFDALEAQYAEVEEFPEEVDARLGEIEAALEGFETRPMRFESEQMAKAGVFVSIRQDGQLAIEWGFVRPEDEAPVEADGAGEVEDVPRDAAGSPQIVTAGQAGRDEEDDEEGIKPLPDRLLTDLTAYRTLALRDALAAHPQIALTALLHKLVRDTFQHRAGTGCLQVSVQHVYLPPQTEGLNDSTAAQSVAARHEAWEAAGLATLLAFTAELATDDDDRLLQALQDGAMDTANDAGQQIVQRQLAVAPTLTIRPGFPLRVIVSRDLVLEPYGG